MGGTTFKVGVIQGGAIDYAREPMVDRLPLRGTQDRGGSPSAPGGGSIVALDPATGVPGVGPASAGARPGPVCYGLGGEEPTLTDVMLLVGYMDPPAPSSAVPSPSMPRQRAGSSPEKVAQPLGMSVEEAAIGIYRIAAAQISDLIHEITVETRPRPARLRTARLRRHLRPALRRVRRRARRQADRGALHRLGERRLRPALRRYRARVHCPPRRSPFRARPRRSTRSMHPWWPAPAISLPPKGSPTMRSPSTGRSTCATDARVHEVTTPVAGGGPMDDDARRPSRCGLRGALRAQVRQGAPPTAPPAWR